MDIREFRINRIKKKAPDLIKLELILRDSNDLKRSELANWSIIP